MTGPQCSTQRLFRPTCVSTFNPLLPLLHTHLALTLDMHAIVILQISHPQVPAPDGSGGTPYPLDEFGHFWDPTINGNGQTLGSLSSTLGGQTSHPQVPAPDGSGGTPYPLDEFGRFWDPAIRENEQVLGSLFSAAGEQA